jgi:hypothetical protein
MLIVFAARAVSGQPTTVRGTVTDSVYKTPLRSVTVYVPGTKIVATTNAEGKYKISSDKPFNQIKTSFLGYKDAFYRITPGTEQVININILSFSKQLKEVVIGGGRSAKYSNKNNPAVELIRKVIENKEKNRPENYPFVEYKEYDKMQFSLSNLPDKASGSKLFHQYKFLLDNRDTTSVPGKSLLPVFLQEKLSQYYYCKNPEREKTITLGEKTVNFGSDIDVQGIGANLKYIFNKADIYSNSILLVNSNFLSPIAGSAPAFYKYFITDTVTENNTKLVELTFTPRNTTDVLFEGRLYITLDGNYAVQGAWLTISKNVNLNFVKSLNVSLEFEQNSDGRYHLSNNKTMADFGISSRGLNLFGIRTVTYKNYIINKPYPAIVYENKKEGTLNDAKNRSEQFWKDNRLDTLTTAESKTYKNIDSLMKMSSFRLTLDVAAVLFGGYKNFGAFEIGPTASFLSFNPVEGFRPQFGGRTTTVFSSRYYFESYAAYGFKDERWKYYASVAYSLNNKSIYKFPENYIKASIQNDLTIPGQDLQLNGQNNLLFSFRRNNSLQYLYDLRYRIDYLHEYENHFSYSFGISRLTQSPAGSLYFVNTGVNNLAQNITGLTTTELTAGLRYAPNEQFYEGKVYRTPVTSRYPVISLNYSEGIKNVFNGQYNYQKLVANVDKRVYLSQFGYADVRLEAGHIFGQVPFPLLNIPSANATYYYSYYSFNLMNFLEFVSDHYESINIDQHFNGFFFNKIPLFKKLKWREVVSFKALYGGLSNQNNPALHPALYQFPVTSTGQALTYALGNTPYEEGSIGIENIFKILRLDMVRRFNYLNHPEVAKWGLRFSFQITF